MLSQSKIEVWYDVSGDRIHLGETCSTPDFDVISLWVGVPFDASSSEHQGYMMSLFDDGGRNIGVKRISAHSAESILSQYVDSPLHQTINQLAFADNQSIDSQSDVAFI